MESNLNAAAPPTPGECPGVWLHVPEAYDRWRELTRCVSAFRAAVWLWNAVGRRPDGCMTVCWAEVAGGALPNADEGSARRTILGVLANRFGVVEVVERWNGGATLRVVDPAEARAAWRRLQTADEPVQQCFDFAYEPNYEPVAEGPPPGPKLAKPLICEPPRAARGPSAARDRARRAAGDSPPKRPPAENFPRGLSTDDAATLAMMQQRERSARRGFGTAGATILNTPYHHTTILPYRAGGPAPPGDDPPAALGPPPATTHAGEPPARRDHGDGPPARRDRGDGPSARRDRVEGPLCAKRMARERDRTFRGYSLAGREYADFESYAVGIQHALQRARAESILYGPCLKAAVAVRDGTLESRDVEGLLGRAERKAITTGWRCDAGQYFVGALRKVFERIDRPWDLREATRLVGAEAAS